MNTCRKYACHRIYDAANHYFPQSVVSIDGEGSVLSIHPLTEEISATEWLGGIIILSPFKSISEKGEALTNLLTIQPAATPQSLYAWHLSAFDFEREKQTRASLLRRL